MISGKRNIQEQIIFEFTYVLSDLAQHVGPQFLFIIFSLSPLNKTKHVKGRISPSAQHFMSFRAQTRENELAKF